ncbi:MAG: (Fe-S)-binding protein [Thermodesulfobacteriota bacterium]
MRVQLFVPCLVENLAPEIAAATARVLARAGAQVSLPPGQTCCGQPLYKSGRHAQARDLARRFLEVFSAPDPVVAPSGSCVAMVRAYPGLLADDPALAGRARDLAARTFELSQFLVDVLQVEDLGAELPAAAAYHDSCQVSRTLGVREQPRRLLSRVRGLTLAEPSRSGACCGFGGTFSLQFPEVSAALTAEKAADLAATGAGMVVCAEPSCLLNLRSHLDKNFPERNMRCLHLAEVLDSRNGVAP